MTEFHDKRKAWPSSFAQLSFLNLFFFGLCVSGIVPSNLMNETPSLRARGLLLLGWEGEEHGCGRQLICRAGTCVWPSGPDT